MTKAERKRLLLVVGVSLFSGLYGHIGLSNPAAFVCLALLNAICMFGAMEA